MKQLVLSIMLCVGTVCVAQNVTIRAVDQPASAVFRSIVRQTGKNFVYSSELLKNMRVSVNVKNKPLKQTLSIIFKDSDIKYEIKGKNIILKRKPKPQKAKNRPSVTAVPPAMPKYDAIVPKMLDETDRTGNHKHSRAVRRKRCGEGIADAAGHIRRSGRDGWYARTWR